MVARSPTNGRAARTRAELAQSAHDEVARTGVLDSGAIASNAGVSTATFYAYFDTHDDAVAAALDISLAAVVNVAERHFHIEALLERSLEAVIDDIIHETHAVFQAENLVMRAALARLAHHRVIRDVYRRHETRCYDFLARQIKLGQKAGLLRDGDPARRATSLLVLMQGINNPLLTRQDLNEEIVADLRRAMTAAIGLTTPNA
jgi:AcrR family transcriptional regulator